MVMVMVVGKAKVMRGAATIVARGEAMSVTDVGTMARMG